MQEHIDADEPFIREEISVAEALERFRSEDQPYKVELIEDLVRNADPAVPSSVSLYTNGHFTDLCRGPHAPSTKRIKAFKLQSVAGAYWRGDANRQMLTRVYGTAFFSRKDLDEYLERLERARANDHRRLGPQLGLFTFSRRVARLGVLVPGRHPGVQLAGRAQPRDGRAPRLHRGQDAAALRQLAVEDLRPLGQIPRAHVHHRVRGPADGAQADELSRATASSTRCARTPTAISRSATPSPGCCTATSRAARCMACCGSATSPRTTRHIFCTEDQIQDEVAGCLEFALRRPMRCSASTSGSSSPPAPSSGSAPTSSGTTARRRCGSALESQGLEYELNEGDGAFYGPKIDMHMTDSLGRSWQLGTVQLDYNFPVRFDLIYTGPTTPSTGR